MAAYAVIIVGIIVDCGLFLDFLGSWLCDMCVLVLFTVLRFTVLPVSNMVSVAGVPPILIGGGSCGLVIGFEVS